MTNGLTVTRHAEARMRQRGYAEYDLEWLLEIGEETHEGLFVTHRRARELAYRFRRLADRIERLAGTLLVIQNGRLVTIYRPDRRKGKRLPKAPRHRLRKRR